jgi:hypothetical protein
MIYHLASVYFYTRNKIEFIRFIIFLLKKCSYLFIDTSFNQIN